MMVENDLFETLFEMFPFGVYVVDIKTYQVIYANRRYQDAHGDCVGKICYQTIYKENSPCHHCKIRQLIDEQGNPNNTTLIFERFNEYNDFWYLHHEKTLYCEDGRVVKYTVEVDICELKATQNRLAEAHALLAIKNRELMEINRHDELTKVFNRSHLNHVLANQIYNAERYHDSFSVVLIDIDDFKKINDTRGHLVGDAVLIEMAQLINNNIRQSDCFGRWGGEEFMIIVPYIKTLSDPKVFVEKLCQLVADYSFSVVGHCTCSFGVAHCTPHDTMISVVKNADDALYFAKSHGKNRVVIYDEMTQK
jgi:diguanylate cyclase (GGDEF)-like protein